MPLRLYTRGLQEGGCTPGTLEEAVKLHPSHPHSVQFSIHRLGRAKVSPTVLVLEAPGLTTAPDPSCHPGRGEGRGCGKECLCVCVPSIYMLKS